MVIPPGRGWSIYLEAIITLTPPLQNQVGSSSARLLQFLQLGFYLISKLAGSVFRPPLHHIVPFTYFEDSPLFKTMKLIIVLVLVSLHISDAWTGSLFHAARPKQLVSNLKMIAIGKKYVPQWKKKETLVEKIGDLDASEKGLTGTVKVVFKTGDTISSTFALPGSPLRDAASATGTYIKYGCGKGDCGTCESMCNGKWIRPCIALVPSDIADGEEYMVQVKATKAKVVSSGKFYSFRSFIMGFWNNFLGMIAFVFRRKAANKNWKDRLDFEDLVAQRAREKRDARLAAQAKEKQNPN